MMKLKGNYVIKEIAGEHLAIYCHEDIVDLRRAISLKGGAKPMFEALLNGADKAELTEILVKDYNIEEKDAEKDAQNFLSLLYNNDLLDGSL